MGKIGCMNSSDLKEVRLRLGLSQNEIAHYLKTPVTTYGKWERGERRVPGIVEVALELLEGKKGRSGE